ncbi:hypothetical protein ACFOYU_19970 [Microvirga sp. GCM10011540]|uniref:hypothetical protein n=1 Tax=Microvirga sp. GCM10011540 TaxID=3317338 RepID=UPI0036204E08
MTAFAAATLIGLIACPLARAEVLLEDQGLYEQQRWNVGKRYDDLDNPRDAPGILTQGRDPANPSGPAVDAQVEPDTSSKPR